MLIGHIAEHRLNDGTDAAEGESQPGGRSQGNALLRNQKGQNGGQSAAADIGAQVPQHHENSIGLSLEFHGE